MLIEFMSDPSCVGGPNTYSNIVTRNNLNTKFGNYIRKHKNLAFTIYFDAKKDVYLYHFKIISISDERIVYDVVLEFTPTKTSIGEPTLINYNMRLFSNSPGFGYLFAYVYKKHSLLIPLLEDKFDDELLTVPPKKSNPTNAVGFDYTIYYAMRFLYLHNFYLDKREIAVKGKKLEKFDHQAILSFNEAFYERSTKDMNLIQKTIHTVDTEVKRTKRKVVTAVKTATKPITSFAKRITAKAPVKSSRPTVKTVAKKVPIGKRRK